ncbi:MAG: YqaJ viral recombinase family protein [Candidatus Woesearchaeota archaeon]|jgi:hypothetical protein
MEDLTTRVFEYLDNIQDIYNLQRCCKTTLQAYRKLNVWNLTSKLGKTPKEKLQIFINFYKHKAQQGSVQWKKEKEGSFESPPTIGGSEIGSLFGINPYSKSKQLIASKLKITKFAGNTATRWGNLFEEVIFMFTEVIFKTKTIETGSIPGLQDEKGNVIQSYSPDRIGVVTKNNFIGGIRKLARIMGINISGKIPNKPELIVLMEGKCPFTRVPGQEIPKQYTLQPQLGASTIKITDVCLYVDAMFRKCSISEFGLDSQFDTNFHGPCSLSQIDEDDEVLAAGFIGIYYKCDVIKETNIPKNESKEFTDTENIKKKLKEYIIGHVGNPGSDFYGVNVHNLSSLMSLCALCDRYLGIIYDDIVSDGFTLNISKENEEDLVIKLLVEFIGEDQETIIKLLVPDALKANYQQSTKYFSKNYSIELDKIGIDYGSSNGKVTAIMLKNVIDDKFSDSGYKIYYPDAFYVATSIKDYFDGEKHYQDDSEPVDIRSKKWLYKQVQIYKKWCDQNSVQSTGILPWKLLKTSYIPMPIDPNFIESAKPKILDIIKTIQQIKKTASISTDSESIEQKIKKEFDKKFPTRSKKPKKENVSSSFTKNLNNDTINEFLNGLDITP